MSTLPQVAAVTDAVPITLEVVPVKGPHVIANNSFVATLTRVERELALLMVDDAQSAQFAADLKQRLTTAGRELEETRNRILAPYRAETERINTAAKPVAARIEAAKAKLNGQIMAFAESERKRLADLERKRLDELAALERQQQAEQAEANRKAKEIADAALAAEKRRAALEAAANAAPRERLQLLTAQHAQLTKQIADVTAKKTLTFANQATVKADLETLNAQLATVTAHKTEASKQVAALDAQLALAEELPPEEPAEPLAPLPPPQKTETEQRIEALRFAPAAVVATPVGIRMVVTLRHEVVDVNLLPEPFVLKTAKDTALRATFTTGWREGHPIPTCPGVRFWIDKQAPSTGRNRF